MTEPRMRPRPPGPQFLPSDLSSYLYAFGDSAPPLPATISCLDEIVTDYIIETCHAAALSASYSRRQKIKVDDFKWALRKDGRKLGRVVELLGREREVRRMRRVFSTEEETKEGMREAAREERRKEREARRKRKRGQEVGDGDGGEDDEDDDEEGVLEQEKEKEKEEEKEKEKEKPGKKKKAKKVRTEKGGKRAGSERERSRTGSVDTAGS
ncbi:hypothetical protein LTS18_004278 [Coniosporium uncinatum]|uniref:Uncharacterized protein n=1 Tax=Coniosporium uncinatum TaxID=93489 RepID=A0ACC3E0B7_9PEZI|nr:hypothetical protein LTS18_004278 [Coniosporium uncinatum]